MEESEEGSEGEADDSVTFHGHILNGTSRSTLDADMKEVHAAMKLFSMDLIESLKARFSDAGVLAYLDIFDPLAYPDGPLIPSWGKDQLNGLLAHFTAAAAKGGPVVPIVNANAARAELVAFTSAVHALKPEALRTQMVYTAWHIKSQNAVTELTEACEEYFDGVPLSEFNEKSIDRMVKTVQRSDVAPTHHMSFVLKTLTQQQAQLGLFPRLL